MSRVPDLVRDSELETRFHGKYTSHRYHETDLANEERAVIRQEYWKRIKHIGGGAYGSVWLEECVKGARDHNFRAVKEILKPPPTHAAIDYNRELEAIAKFSHDRYVRCFVKSFGWYEHGSTLHIAMEYFSHGDLQNYLMSSPPMPEPEVQQVYYQLIEGLNFLHQNGFAHRDMKPGNILVKAKPPSRWWVKIGDFGISKRIEDGLHASSTIKGTLGFMSPELHGLMDKSDCFENTIVAACAADMWALGEVVFRMLTKSSSFPNLANLVAFARNLEQFPTGALQKIGASDESADLIQAIMQPSPRNRLSALEALKHSWTAFLRAPSPRPLSLASNESSNFLGEPSTTGTSQHPEPSAKWSTVSVNDSNTAALVNIDQPPLPSVPSPQNEHSQSIQALITEEHCLPNTSQMPSVIRQQREVTYLPKEDAADAVTWKSMVQFQQKQFQNFLSDSHLAGTDSKSPPDVPSRIPRRNSKPLYEETHNKGIEHTIVHHPSRVRKTDNIPHGTGYGDGSKRVAAVQKDDIGGLADFDQSELDATADTRLPQSLVGRDKSPFRKPVHGIIPPKAATFSRTGHQSSKSSEIPSTEKDLIHFPSSPESSPRMRSTLSLATKKTELSDHQVDSVHSSANRLSNGEIVAVSPENADELNLNLLEVDEGNLRDLESYLVGDSEQLTATGKVHLQDGNIVLDLLQVQDDYSLVKQLDSGPLVRNEFTHFRYTAVVDSTKDFADKYSLRPRLFKMPRQVEVLVTLQLRSLFERSRRRTQINLARLRGVFDEVDRLASDDSFTQSIGGNGWKTILVAIFDLGLDIEGCNELLIAFGLQSLWSVADYSLDSVDIVDSSDVLVGRIGPKDHTPRLLNGRAVTAHLYEFTTRMDVENLNTGILRHSSSRRCPIQLVLVQSPRRLSTANHYKAWNQAIHRASNARYKLDLNLEWCATIPQYSVCVGWKQAKENIARYTASKIVREDELEYQKPGFLGWLGFVKYRVELNRDVDASGTLSWDRNKWEDKSGGGRFCMFKVGGGRADPMVLLFRQDSRIDFIGNATFTMDMCESGGSLQPHTFRARFNIVCHQWITAIQSIQSRRWYNRQTEEWEDSQSSVRWI